MSKKPCPPGKILNPTSNRCVSETGKIGKKVLEEEKKKSLVSQQKQCPPNKIYNPKSNRCVLKSGKIGKQLLLEKATEQKKVIPSKKAKQKKVIPTKIKVCKAGEIFNPENNKCYSLTGKIGKEILKKQFFQEHKKAIESFIPYSSTYDKTFVENIIKNCKIISNYMKYENYVYKGHPSLDKDEEFEKEYRGWNRLESTKSLEEIKKSMDKGDPYDFSKLSSMLVPFVKKTFDSVDAFLEKSKFSEVNGGIETLHGTPTFRFPVKWMIEQVAYWKDIPKEEREFLKDYSMSGYRQINSFVNKGSKVTITIRNRSLLEKIYSCIFKDKPTDEKIMKHMHALYSIAILRMNEIIKKAPPLPEDVLVFKGLKMKFNPEYKTFISTSFSIRIGNSFQGGKCCKAYIILKKGTHALALFLISIHNEKEVLLPFDIHLKLIQNQSTKINKNLQSSTTVDIYEASN